MEVGAKGTLARQMVVECDNRARGEMLEDLRSMCQDSLQEYGRSVRELDAMDWNNIERVLSTCPSDTLAQFRYHAGVKLRERDLEDIQNGFSARDAHKKHRRRVRTLEN